MAKNYNPKEILCIVSGLQIEGFGTDTFVECAFVEDKNTLTVSNDGMGTFNENPNESGTIKFTLMHNSDSVEVLSALALQNKIPYEIAIFDPNTLNGKALGINCKLKKKPDFTRAKEVGTVEFEYICEKLRMY